MSNCCKQLLFVACLLADQGEVPDELLYAALCSCVLFVSNSA